MRPGTDPAYALMAQQTRLSNLPIATLVMAPSAALPQENSQHAQQWHKGEKWPGNNFDVLAMIGTLFALFTVLVMARGNFSVLRGPQEAEHEEGNEGHDRPRHRKCLHVRTTACRCVWARA